MTAAVPAALRRQRLDRGALGVDRRSKAAIPGHVHEPSLVDLVDDPAVSGAQARVVARSRDELDPRADCDTRADPCRKESSTVGVHGSDIGFAPDNLYPPPDPRLSVRRRRVAIGEVAHRRRAVPKSTA